ncbi:histidine phosphatase family protein [Emydomyces testavorans]|uniref:Histidine phosphatase family protein n=1 Tax=Emydomyces testavorans TaxID=2070801 RepID=A0AAF0DN31_9EURO|nr:histidine phosphatase family protein [Emydomyces testavorans]
MAPSQLLLTAVLSLSFAIALSLPTGSFYQFFQSLFFSQPTSGTTHSHPFSSSFPHVSSWNSWWHPHSAAKWKAQNQLGHWNLLYHLGGNGPWIEKIDGVLDAGDHGIGPPPGCVVDSHLATLSRIKSSGLPMNGTLAFLNNWTYITQTPQDHFEQLISHGPYAGTLQAFTTGVRLRTRYSHLLSHRKHTRFWASDCQRVIDSARYFAFGFFGWNWEREKLAALEIIPETADRAADTLTPGDTCTRYVDDLEHGHDKGVKMLAKFQEAYIPPISDRLNKENPDIRFTNTEIYSMQEMCGFETLTRGISPWCDVFSTNDWEHFEYARDLLHYYRAGPGNPYAPAMGWLWLNRTTELLLHPSNEGDIFFSLTVIDIDSVHDGDIAPMLSALKLFDDINDLPTTNIAKNRNWRTSQVMPMGGRILLERLVCEISTSVQTEAPTDSNDDADTSRFVRININDGIVLLPDCSSGPGSSCPLSQFAERTRLRGEEVGGFETVCGLEGGRKEGITFLRQQ